MTIEALEAEFGFPFPDELEAFAELVRCHPDECESLGVAPVGPLKLLVDREDELEWFRFYDDPPEMVTMLQGSHDGLRWGYWFDDPGRVEPIVVSGWAVDGGTLSVSAATLYETLRLHLEALQQDIEIFARDDVAHASDYEEKLARFAVLRERLAEDSDVLRSRSETGSAYFEKYCGWLPPWAVRRVLAPTYTGMGIVVEPTRYRPLRKNDPFCDEDAQPWLLGAATVQDLVHEAQAALEQGFFGTALKLGHDLWLFPAYRHTATELLDRAYGALDREELRPLLQRAIAWRERCDAQRR